MNEEQKPAENSKNTEENRKVIEIINQVDPRNLVSVIWKLIVRETKYLTNIRYDADIPNTIDDIKNNIEFRGVNVWILAFSIVIASIGLNTNSGAVIIGAMLISPLMGPILGVGLSVGINDWSTLLKSLKAFLIMILLSLGTSTLYFLSTPIHKVTPELMARTTPTPLDVIVAFTGGLAGIIAGSRKVKSNVIPGVAIATALMPPLCTAGFGIANGNLRIFAGASYLFLLNSVFISISTYMVVKYLRFPMKEQVSKKVSKRVNAYMLIFILIIIIPSGLMFVDMIRESSFTSKAEAFVEEKVKSNNAYFGDPKMHYSKDSTVIEIPVLSGEATEEEIKKFTLALPEYGLEGTKLNIHQARPEDYKNEQQTVISETDIKINNLNKEIVRINHEKDSLSTHYQARMDSITSDLTAMVSDTLPMKKINKEISINYPNIVKVEYNTKEVTVDSLGTKKRVYGFYMDYKYPVGSYTRKTDSKKLSAWLKERLELDSVQVNIVY